jgi:hypothetical protein
VPPAPILAIVANARRHRIAAHRAGDVDGRRPGPNSMHPLPSALVAGLALPLLAQAPLPTTIQPVQAPFAMRQSAGLQPAGAAALRGGGAEYRAQFDASGMRYEPALGRAVATTQHLALTAVALHRGGRELVALPTATAPVADGLVATYAHAPGVVERYEVRPEGVELTWQLATEPAGAGDLVVRYALDSSLGEPIAHGDGLRWVGPHGGVQIGGVTGIDAAGRTMPGGLQWVAGGLELSLPHAFLATATYPIVLDPLIGSVIAVSSGLTYADGVPDAAYDATTNRFLVVFEREFSASNVDIRGQFVTAGGTLVGGTIFFGSSGVARSPRVANLGVRDRFGVVWNQLAAGTSTVQLQTVEAGSGALNFTVVVASTTTSEFSGADIGAQVEAAIGSARGFVVVYQDDDVDAIRARRIWFNTNDSILTSSSFNVLADGLLGPFHSQPAIARAAAADGKLLVVARRQSSFGLGSSIQAVVLDAGSNLVGTVAPVASSSNDELFRPDVDGYASKWVVGWERAGSGLVFDAVRVAPVTYDSTTLALTVGAVTTFGGTSVSRADAPTIGYTPGRTWVGYQLTSTLPTTTTTLRVAAIDSGTCAACNDTFSEPFPDGDRIVVATMTSGGRTSGEDCLCVYHWSFDDVGGQLLRNYGTSGSVTDLGGACGSSGLQLFSHSPGIGSSGLVNTLSGLPPTTLAAIFNFSAPTTTSVCGPCVWTPFSVTLSPPILAGSASVEFAVPCLQSLVGAQFETQWTTIDFSQAPCPFFPGLTNSNRLLLTIGN